MKSNYLFSSMLALATVVVASCSAPRLAQQNSNDDVYNSVAQAKEYRQQVPVREKEYNDAEYDDYGTSDPYYDMDYSSRINRFSYGNPSWRGYYDPYFDGGWSGNYGMSLGFGFGYNPFYGSLWGSPYNSWGNYYSPFFGYNNFGYNNYYGGGYYGGGYYGGGNYWGGGFYTGRTTPVDYRARPSRGVSNGYSGRRGDAYLSPRSSRGQSAIGNTSNGRPVRGDINRTRPVNGESSRPVSRPSRTDNTAPARESARPARESSRPARESSRPTRESYTPPPTYTPSRSSEGRSSGGGNSGGGSYGGGGGSGRPTRGGR